MRKYKLQLIEKENDNYNLDASYDLPFICVNDKGNYSLIYETTENKYSAIDLETGKQINGQHLRLSGLFENYPNVLGKPIESEIMVIK